MEIMMRKKEILDFTGIDEIHMGVTKIKKNFNSQQILQDVLDEIESELDNRKKLIQIWKDKINEKEIEIIDLVNKQKEISAILLMIKNGADDD